MSCRICRRCWLWLPDTAGVPTPRQPPLLLVVPRTCSGFGAASLGGWRVTSGVGLTVYPHPYFHEHHLETRLKKWALVSLISRPNFGRKGERDWRQTAKMRRASRNSFRVLLAFAACTELFQLIKARRHLGLLGRALIQAERNSVQKKKTVLGKALCLKSNGKSETKWIKFLTCCANQVKHLNKWNKPMIIIVEISGVNKLYLYANFSTDSEQVKA